MNNQEHELDWQAFRYISGEMTPDEAAAFEDRLSEDQPARDAVCAAVGLSQTILAAETLAVRADLAAAPMPACQAQAKWSLKARWFALGAAACWFLVIAIGAWRLPDAPQSVSAELAQAWSDQMGTIELPAETEATAQESFEVQSIETDEPLDPVLAAEVPGWMVEAVHSLQIGDVEGRDPGVLEEREG